MAEQMPAGRRGSAPKRVRVVATACIRAAVNRDEFLAGMSEQVEILDGDEEARLAFLGATSTLGRSCRGWSGSSTSGAAPTKIAVGTSRTAYWSSSFLVGSGALAERYLRSDPPSLDELRAVREHACDVFGARAVPRADCAVAVGGSAASLRRLVGDVLDGDSLRNAIGALSGAPAAEVAERLALDPAACG